MSKVRKITSAAVCALPLLVGSTQARAEEAQAGEKAACKNQSNALSEVGCELSRSIALSGPTLVVAGLPSSETTLDKPEALAQRVARVVAGSLGELAELYAEPADLARAQSLARKPGTLLYLSIEISRGKIRVTGDVYRVKKNFWDRVKDRAPTPTQHGFGERTLDAELRTFLPFVPVIAKVTHQAVPPERAPVALACGDANGDGSSEIAFVGRHRVYLGRIEGKRFVTLAEASWSSLSPIAPAPLREPIAAAWFRPDGTLDIGSSDRAHFVRVDGELHAIARAPRRVPWGGSCAGFDGIALSSRPIRCLDTDPAPPSSKLDLALDSVATGSAPGEAPTIAGRDARSNQVTIVTAEQRAELSEAGAQLAVSDLNGDGRLEVVTSENTYEAGRDVLTIHTLGDAGKLERKLRIPVNEGITALAVCPQPSDGLAPVIVGTERRLWVVR